MWGNDDYIMYNAIDKTTCKVYLQICKIIGHQINSMCKYRQLERGAERNTINLLPYSCLSLWDFLVIFILCFMLSFFKIFYIFFFSSVQLTSVAQLCLTVCDPMNRSTPGLPVHYQLPELTQTHVIESVMPSSHLSSVMPFSSCPQSLPASESFPMSQLFA